jgi:hypothetical protein
MEKLKCGNIRSYFFVATWFECKKTFFAQTREIRTASLWQPAQLGALKLHDRRRKPKASSYNGGILTSGGASMRRVADRLAGYRWWLPLVLD